jgi:hypothetical protein
MSRNRRPTEYNNAPTARRQDNGDVSVACVHMRSSGELLDNLGQVIPAGDVPSSREERAAMVEEASARLCGECINTNCVRWYYFNENQAAN